MVQTICKQLKRLPGGGKKHHLAAIKKCFLKAPSCTAQRHGHVIESALLLAGLGLQLLMKEGGWQSMAEQGSQAGPGLLPLTTEGGWQRMAEQGSQALSSSQQLEVGLTGQADGMTCYGSHSTDGIMVHALSMGGICMM